MSEPIITAFDSKSDHSAKKLNDDELPLITPGWYLRYDIIIFDVLLSFLSVFIETSLLETFSLTITWFVKLLTLVFPVTFLKATSI